MAQQTSEHTPNCLLHCSFALCRMSGQNSTAQYSNFPLCFLRPLRDSLKQPSFHMLNFLNHPFCAMQKCVYMKPVNLNSAKHLLKEQSDSVRNPQHRQMCSVYLIALTVLSHFPHYQAYYYYCGNYLQNLWHCFSSHSEHICHCVT